MQHLRKLVPSNSGLVSRPTTLFPPALSLQAQVASANIAESICFLLRLKVYMLKVVERNQICWPIKYVDRLSWNNGFTKVEFASMNQVANKTSIALLQHHWTYFNDAVYQFVI